MEDGRIDMEMDYNVLRKSIQAQALTPEGMFLFGWMNTHSGIVRDPIGMDDYPLYVWKDGWGANCE